MNKKFPLNIETSKEIAMEIIDRRFSELAGTKKKHGQTYGYDTDFLLNREYLLGMCSAFDIVSLFDFKVFKVVFDAIQAIKKENEDG